jgi:ubiquinone/menaquinone biosynthesis C-methylase UbiE
VRDFYEHFYRMTEHSPVHDKFCQLVFGHNLCQHGFVDMAQLDALLTLIHPRPSQHILDVGCGNGMIAEYVAERTGARVTGLDYIPAAVEQAARRTASNSHRLNFIVADINALTLPECAYDIILSLDSIYFSDDYAQTIRQFARALKPDGQMAIFYSYGREPWVPADEFPADKLLPDQTPLADALKANGLTFTVQDFTEADYQLAQRRKQVLADLRPQFEAEGLGFVYENRLGDANGISQAVEERLHRRYLYLASAQR